MGSWLISTGRKTAENREPPWQALAEEGTQARSSDILMEPEAHEARNGEKKMLYTLEYIS